METGERNLEVMESDPINPIQDEISGERMIEEDLQDMNIITVKQQRHLNNARPESSTQLLKSKSIMERFVKPKGGMENKSAGLLRANSVGSFKSQKTKKNNQQWGKTKALLNTKDFSEMNSTLIPKSYTQEEVEDTMLNNRPPNPDITKSREEIGEEQVVLNKRTLRKGKTPSMGS